MSKSTPLNQLPNMQQNTAPSAGQAMDNTPQSNEGGNDKENQLVNDILNEIENSNSSQGSVMQNHIMDPQVNKQVEQRMEPQIEPPMMHQNIEQPIQQAPSGIPEGMKMNIEEFNNNDSKTPKTLTEKILDVVKQPLIVAAICILMSIPKLSVILTSILPKKEFVLNNANIFITIIKGLLGGILFYAINSTL